MSTTPETPVAPSEQPTTHSRKAQITTIALVVLVVVGLIINTFANLNKRDKRAEKQAEDDAKKEAISAPRPEVKLSDFAAKQREAAGQLSSEAKANQEEEHKNHVLDTLQGNGASAGGIEKKTPASIADEFLLNERKRVLDAMTGSIGRATPASGAPAQRGGPQTNAAEIARVDEKIAALSAVPDSIAQRQRELVERARAAGIPLPDQIVARVGGGAGAMPSAMSAGAGLAPAMQRVSSQTAGTASFGEMASNRVARDPASSGPQPGEKILPTGSIISAVLDMNMVSDYAGNWIALVQRPVYDVELENILLPAGTKIVGKSVRMTSVNEAIQNRMGSIPLWAIRPDGKRIDFKLTSGMDAAGVAALKDTVDRHFLAQFFGVGAYAVIGLGPSLSNYGSQPESSRDAFIREATAKSRDIGRAFAEKYLNIVPTVTIRAGTPMKIFVEDDIYIKPWEEIDATHYNTH